MKNEASFEIKEGGLVSIHLPSGDGRYYHYSGNVAGLRNLVAGGFPELKSFTSTSNHKTLLESLTSMINQYEKENP